MSEIVSIYSGGQLIADGVRAEVLTYEERGFLKFRGALHIPDGKRLPTNIVVRLSDGSSAAATIVSNPENPRRDSDGNQIIGFLSSAPPTKTPTFRNR